MEFVFMENSLAVFLGILLLVFALGLFLAGAFTVYFGSGKSRGIGAGLLIGGILVALLVMLACKYDVSIFQDIWLGEVIAQAIVYLVAALLGLLAAIGLFLLAIMKS